MKKTISIIMIIGIISGFLVGMLVYKSSQKEYVEEVAQKEFKHKEIAKNVVEDKLVNSNLSKITPNTKIVEKIRYEECNHEIIEIKEPSEDLINLTEKEFLEKYKEWKVQEFNNDEVVICKECKGFCNEHYLLKDDLGYLIIYELDKDDNIKGVFAKTSIYTECLPEDDKKNLTQGIKVYTKSELDKIIEDFE